MSTQVHTQEGEMTAHEISEREIARRAILARDMLLPPLEPQTYRQPQISTNQPATWVELAPTGRATATQASPQGVTTHTRLIFLDNLRWALTILVIVHHLAITYGAEGSWYYIEGQSQPLVVILLTLFAGLNQGFFMGLFFLLSGYFVPASLERKGTRRFLQDRLLRLGIPLLAFTLVISPFLEAFSQIQEQGDRFTRALWWQTTLMQWQNFDFGPGPLWFVEALLIFSLLYVMGMWLARTVGKGWRLASLNLTNGGLIALAIGITFLSFITRLAYPIGAEWHHFQLAFFPQYIALFAGGLLAYHYRWLSELPTNVTRLWRVIALIGLLALPSMMGIISISDELELAFGGWHWQALLFSFWEAFYAIAMSIALISLFRRHFNYRGAPSHFFSTYAYAAFFIHPAVVVALAFALRGLAVNPIFKFGLLSGPAVALTFLVAYLLVEWLPGAKRLF